MKIVARSTDEDRHKQDIESVVIFGDRVFTAAHDGKVKIWSKSNLNLIHQFKAHDYGILHLLIFEGFLYTASVDQTIKVWQMDTWTLERTLADHEETPKRLVTDGKNIYSGDDKGEVFKWSTEGDLLERIELLEEVWDLHVLGNRIYSIRDRGLTVTETKENSKVHCAAVILEGRAPIIITQKDILVCNRSGTSIDHFNNTPPKCQHLKEFKGEHDKIITILGLFGNCLFSGGWDNKLVQWNLDQGSMISCVQLPECPAAIAVSEEDRTVYVGGAEGYLVKLQIA